MKFNPSTVIVPKTTLAVNQPHINKKLVALNNALQFVFFIFYLCVVTLSIDKIYEFTFFSRGGVYFPYQGNQPFSRLLHFLIYTFAPY